MVSPLSLECRELAPLLPGAPGAGCIDGDAGGHGRAPSRLGAGLLGQGWGTGWAPWHSTPTPKPCQILLEEEQQASFSTPPAPPCSTRAQVAVGADSVLPD